MNILILGGAGFIGQHLTHELLKIRHNHVTVIDSLITSNINLTNFNKYENSYNFIEGDIREIDDAVLLKIFRKQTLIYNLAGSVGVEYIDKYPEKSLFNNIELTNKLIPLFTKANKHVIFASTSEIYGDKATGSFSENDNASIGPTTKLRWGYAMSKLMTEFMMSASTFPYNIIRFFNVVGPGQIGDYGMVLPKFVNAAKENKPLTIYGDGSQVRCFCHISDAIDALIRIPEYESETFNIGNDVPTTIKELAEQVISISGSKSEIIYVPYEEAFSNQHQDILRRVPNIYKLKQTGYFPSKSLTDIIKDML